MKKKTQSVEKDIKKDTRSVDKDKRKAASQMETKSASGEKTKASRRALSQTQRIEEEFEENLLDINLKRPKQPFNFFIQEMFSKEGGRIDSKTMKDFGKKFKSISEKDRARYSELSEKDRDRYEEHLSLVHQHLIKKPDQEKKTGYNYFIDEQIGKAMEKGEDATDARIKATQKWHSLEDGEKEKYMEMSTKNRDLYEKLRNLRGERISAYLLFSRDKMASAREKEETLTIKDCAGLWKKSKDSVKEKYEDYAKELKEEIEKSRDLVELTFNIKPSRPISAFAYFMKEVYQTGEVKGFGKIKQVSEKWEKTSEEDRDKYLRMAKRDRLVYIIKKRNYDAMIRKDMGKAPSPLNLYMADHAGEKMNLQEMYGKWKS